MNGGKRAVHLRFSGPAEQAVALSLQEAGKAYYVATAGQTLTLPIFGMLGKILRGTSDSARAQRGAAFAFAIRVASAGIAFLSQILLARWMGAFEFGIFAYVWVFVIILGSLSTIGLNTSVLRFLPEYKEKAQWRLFKGFLDGSRWITLGISTAVTVAGIAVTWALHEVIPDYYLVPLVIAFFCLPGYAITDMQDGISRSQSWIDLALIPPYMLRPFAMLMLFGAGVWAGYPATALSALVAALGATYITTCVQLMVMTRRFGGGLPECTREYRVPLWLKVSAPIMLMHGFFILLQHVDILVLNLYVSPSDVAIYYAAIKTTGLVAFVHFAVGAAFAPRFSEYFAAGRMSDLGAHLRESIKWSFWPSLLASAGILAVGYPLLWLFGPEFTAGYPVMFVLACGLVVRAALGPAEPLLSVLGQQKICALVMFFTLIINVAMNFALIPVFGLLGAAAATTFSIMLESVLLFWIIKWRLGLHAFVFGGKTHPTAEEA